MTGPELSVLMVTYNAAELLERTLLALTGAAAPSVPFEVLVSDNDSADGAAEVAERLLGPDAVRRLGANTGFAHGVNRAAERASGRYVLLLNPDAEPMPGAIDALLAHLKANPRHGIVGGRTLRPDGELDPRSCFGRMTPWSVTCSATGISSLARGSRWFDPEAIGNFARDRVRHVEVISGGFMLLAKHTWDELGGLDEAYRIYGEDQDLCLRAAALGYRPSITPDAQAVHAVGASSTNRPDRDVLVLAGRASVVQRHFGSWRRYGLLALRTGVRVRMIAERLLGRPPRWAAVWRRRGEWERGWPGTWQARSDAAARA
ncbi:glycosyltransferase family 2 protein [Actinokineospora xionganensis]|uniref:Glycosyltransferase family 2 protein n=1 Tax=Actinokineospora xionganensis TaxID=2684470 RepID=A0ABR7L1P4_9PSEU|nr:glycosyltransferase family 2 protein [Actinokineospora xionganensis]MBC6446608.1 glycosyltransferase family 2 protein [Actinokineospora xionganensis]